MKRTLQFAIATLVCAGSAAVFTQSQQPTTGFPVDDTAYQSTFVPRLPVPGPDMKVDDDATARREWMRERMGGPLSSEFMDALLAAAETQRARYPNAATKGAGGWVNVGPVRSNWIQNGGRLTKSDTGRLRTILVHPTNPDIVYLLTSGGGLWKTNNFLSPRPDWTPKSDQVLGVAGGSAAFGGSANTLYLGSGDPFDGGVGGFVAKSVNGGDSWAHEVKVGIATTIMDVKVDGSSGTDVVFVASNAGLFRSTNAGASYQGVGLPNTGAFIAWSLAQVNGAWLATFEHFSGAGAIYRSTNGGASWTAVVPFGTSDIGRVTLGVGEPGDPVVYAFAAKAGDSAQRDLFRSSDGGQTWTALGLATKAPVNPNPEQPDMNIMADQAFYNHMLLVDPSDATRNTVYIGGQLSSAKTTDGGATWRITSNWLAQFGLPYVHADFHAAAASPLTKSILVGSDGGLFVSSDGGASFSDRKNDGIASYLIYALATNEKHADDVIVGLQDNGTRVRVGNSDTYNQVFGGDGFGVGWSSGVSLGSIYYSFIIRNPHGTPATEQKWKVGWNGIAADEFFNPAKTQFITTIYQPNRQAAPDGETYFHRTKRTLYKTTNAAELWTPVYKLPAAVAGEFRGVTHVIGTGYDNLQEIGVAMTASRVAISLDGGQTFAIKSLAGVPGFGGFTSAVAWARPGEVYVATENPNPAQAHLVKSVDGGATWTRADVANGLPAVPISKLLVSHRDASRRTIYAGTWLGVYESTDAGATWHLFGNGMPLVMVSDLYMPVDGSFLRAGTYGRGVWDFKY